MPSISVDVIVNWSATRRSCNQLESRSTSCTLEYSSHLLSGNSTRLRRRAARCVQFWLASAGAAGPDHCTQTVQIFSTIAPHQNSRHPSKKHHRLSNFFPSSTPSLSQTAVVPTQLTTS